MTNESKKRNNQTAPHGGKRPGAGRKPAEIQTVCVSITIPLKEMEECLREALLRGIKITDVYRERILSARTLTSGIESAIDYVPDFGETSDFEKAVKVVEKMRLP